MFKPYELFVGLRYTRAKRRNHFISFISLISILGIALGVATLIIVISVMNGFEKELRGRILSMASHATISEYGEPLLEWEQVMAKAGEHPEVLASAPYIEGEVMLNNGRRVSGALIRGVMPEFEKEVSDVAEKMVIGRLDTLAAGEYGIVLGTELAMTLSARVGDKITLITPQANSTPVGVLPRLKRFTVVGMFEVGMYEYDRTLAFLHIQDAAKLMRISEGVTGVRLKLQDMFRARSVGQEVSMSLDKDYWVSDWTRRHANFFSAVQMEKRVMFIILTLILTVAAFNIVSTLIMVVTDKQSDIAILRTLGASPKSIMKVFIVQGTIIGVFGALVGVVLGVIVALNVGDIVAFLENLLHVKFLKPDVYYISDLPSDMHWSDVIMIGALSFVLSVVATIYPAWRAAKTEPVEALRYE